MLILKNISFQYSTDTVFDIPDIHLKEGEELLILGKSGSGKTTILNIIGGLLKPHSGDVILGQTAIYHLKGNKQDRFRGKNIGIIFQKPHLLKPLTVIENIQLAQHFGDKPNNRSIEKSLEDLGILDRKNAKVNTLSEGESQRVSIARALVNRPKIILADEPTASLDDDNANVVIRILKEQANKLKAVLVVVTHDQRVKKHISNQLIVGKKT